jgi:hypothetical protein
MPRLKNGIAGSVIVLILAMSLTTPLHAARRDRGPEQTPIIKMLKNLIARAFGDGLTDPKP